MCGIVAILRYDGTAVENADIETMLASIAYRGPDGSGVLARGGTGLGHVRLSIQDLTEHAVQPMTSSDGNYTITYNGEIYNVAELRRELVDEGVAFTSTGDTQVLIEYIARFGVDSAVRKIEGMFAFALWDERQRALVLARDRHGIKPLHYRRVAGSHLAVASEMKALLRGAADEPDLITVNATLLGLGGTWGRATAFRNICHVEAGTVLTCHENGEMKCETFFDVADFIDEKLYRELQRLSAREIVDLVDRKLAESVKRRLISDAPVATFVSGGVDSSIVAALAARSYPNMGLYHASVVRDCETAHATELARQLELPLHTVAVSDSDVLELTPEVTYHYELPIMYHFGSCVPFYLVSRLAGRDGIKVVLTGEGADEYFMGYPWLAIHGTVRRLRQAVRGVQRAVHWAAPALGRLAWPSEAERDVLQVRDLQFRYELQQRVRDAEARFSFVKSAVEREYHVLCLDMVAGNVRTLLMRNDRLGMAWGLESRFPFLGHELARIAVNMPVKYKLRRGLRFRDWRHPFVSDKWVVRAGASQYMSKALAFRRKYGFRSTVYTHVQVDREFFRGGFVEQYYRIGARGMEELHRRLTPGWLARLLMLEVWGQVFPLGWRVDQSRDHIRRHVRVLSA